MPAALIRLWIALEAATPIEAIAHMGIQVSASALLHPPMSKPSLVGVLSLTMSKLALASVTIAMKRAVSANNRKHFISYIHVYSPHFQET
jgi:hypothetical protein